MSKVPFYLSAMRKPPNDTEYNGNDTFTRLVEKGKLGPQVDLTSLRVGFYQFWINSYCYTGWGSIGTGDYARAYILIKNLPLSTLTDIEEHHLVVVTKDRRGNTIHRLIEPPTGDELFHYEILIRHFLTQACLSNTFYKNVLIYFHNSLSEKTITPKHTNVHGWKRVTAIYAEALELIEFAEYRSKSGKSTYGCMFRSTNYHLQMELAHKRVVNWYNVKGIDPITLDVSSNLGAYLLRTLEQYAERGKFEEVKEIMEFMVNELQSKIKIDPDIIPNEITLETTKTFRADFMDKYCYKPNYDLFDMS